MIPVFIGHDRRETVAWHTLAHSLIRHSSEPLALTPIGNDTLPDTVWWRPPGPYDSTAFSNARFAVPALMDFKGWAIFMDCDMVATDDIAKLWQQRDDRYAVMVRKHHHRPQETSKFLGARQTVYPRKNWSSLMLFNCAHPATRHLDPTWINRAEGLELHGFAWAPDDAIGEIRGDWNWLAPAAVRSEALPARVPPLIHYTLGGPWHGEGPDYALAWTDELLDMLGGGNPCAGGSAMINPDDSVDLSLRYAKPDRRG